MPRERDASCAEGSTAWITCLAHLYRAEMQRMTVWRTRLDTTTHWAIILTIGVTTFTLGSRAMPHFAMLLALTFNSILMLLEGRRYQHLHHSKWRLSLLEHNFFAARLCDAEPVEPTWREQLGADLRRPHFTISLSMGTRLRLRRNYLILMYFTTAIWLTKLFIHPAGPAHWTELYRRMAIAELFPSWFVLATAVLFISVITLIAALTPSEEALDHWAKVEHARFISRIEDDHNG